MTESRRSSFSAAGLVDGGLIEKIPLVLPDAGAVGRAGAGAEIGDEAAVMDAGHRLLDGGMFFQQGFDFSQLDAEATDLDLVVHAAEAFEGAVRRPAREVAGSIEFCTGAEWRVDEAVRREIGKFVIAGCESVATDEKFAGDADRLRLHGRIHDINLGVVDRVADENRSFASGESCDGGPDGGLGGAVNIPDFPAERGEAVHQIARHGLTADEDFEVGFSLPLGFQQNLQVAGVACSTVTLWRAMAAARSCPSSVVSRVAITVSAPVVSGRKISRPEMSNDNVVTDRRTSSAVSPGSRRMDVEEIHHRAVGDAHALRPTGGAGGEDDVSGVLRIRIRPG